MNLGLSGLLQSRESARVANIIDNSVSRSFIPVKTCGQVRDKFLRPANAKLLVLLIQVIRARLRVLIEVDIWRE